MIRHKKLQQNKSKKTEGKNEKERTQCCVVDTESTKRLNE